MTVIWLIAGCPGPAPMWKRDSRVAIDGVRRQTAGTRLSRGEIGPALRTEYP